MNKQNKYSARVILDEYRDIREREEKCIAALIDADKKFASEVALIYDAQFREHVALCSSMYAEYCVQSIINAVLAEVARENEERDDATYTLTFSFFNESSTHTERFSRLIDARIFAMNLAHEKIAETHAEDSDEFERLSACYSQDSSHLVMYNEKNERTFVSECSELAIHIVIQEHINAAR